MRDLPVARRLLQRGIATLCLAAAGAMLPARAHILVQDQGEQGLVLRNEHATGEAVAPPEVARIAPPAARPRPPAGAQRKALFAPLVRAAARTHGLPEALLHAVIETESGFDAAAVSPAGALGLMQLMPATARALQVRDARDPAANIDGGARYLKDLLARFGNDLALALAAYNAGPGAVQRSGGIPRIPETQAYVPRVIARYHALQSGAD
jgi:soluble lytic murein transglycosylase-like protein